MEPRASKWSQEVANGVKSLKMESRGSKWRTSQTWQLIWSMQCEFGPILGRGVVLVATEVVALEEYSSGSCSSSGAGGVVATAAVVALE
jgi:hypothetical protein